MKKVMMMAGWPAARPPSASTWRGERLEYRKTQTVEILGDAIDTPGEYVENRALMRGLTVTAVDADAVLFLQDCTDPECRFSPGQAAIVRPPGGGGW